MRIEGLTSQPKVSETQQRHAAVRTKKGREQSADVVEISQSAQDVSELGAQAKTAPTGNEVRIQEVRARVQAGYYDSRQVREEIADSLLSSNGMQEVVSDIAETQVAKQQLANVPDTRAERVDEARQRVDSGFYDRPQIRQDTADRILDEMA
jgi:anti-sigma28 factor (negative regulator of flagellin synthesis)